MRYENSMFHISTEKHSNFITQFEDRPKLIIKNFVITGNRTKENIAIGKLCPLLFPKIQKLTL